MGLGETQMAEQDKLRGAENYPQWADESENILVSKGLERFIDENYVMPEPLPLPTDPANTADAARYAAREAEIAVWKANNAKSIVTIQRNLTQQPKDLVRGIKSASAM